MTVTAKFEGGPMDGCEKEVAPLSLGLPQTLLPHVCFEVDGERVYCAPEDPFAQSGGVIYRQVWFKEKL